MNLKKKLKHIGFEHNTQQKLLHNIMSNNADPLLYEIE